MVYTAPDQFFLKKGLGTDSKVVAAELVKIDAELDRLTLYNDLGIKVAKIAVAGGIQNAISFAWQNPETTDILITKAVLSVTTEGATGGATLDIGAVADATSTADTIMDGVAVTAKGLFDNVTNKGTNGLPQIVVNASGGTASYITGKIIGAAAAALVGKLYVFYTKV
jgi:hypothetical protein